MKIHGNGIDIHYEIAGEGPVVMFAHSLGSDLSIWAAQKSALAARHTVLSYDLRGHGQTTATAGPYSFDLLVRDAIALLDALKINKTSFVGISLGGMIGQALAVATFGRLDRLVLADTTSRYPPEIQAIWPERIRQIEVAGLDPLVGPTLERWFTASFRTAHAQRTTRIGELIRSTPIAGYIGCCHAIASLDFFGQLKRISVPTLVLVGDEDPGTPPPMARELADTIPNARLEIIACAAHLSCVEQPEIFNQLLLEFIDG